MKNLLTVFAGLSLVWCAGAADITGHWSATSAGRNGQQQETGIWIDAKGDAFTGYMDTGRNGKAPIVDGKVDGDKLTFTVVTEQYGEEHRQEYTANITPDGLVIHMPAGGRGGGGFGGPGRAGRGTGAGAAAGPAGGGRGGQPRDLIAKRVSKDVPTPLPPKLTAVFHDVKDNGLARTPPMGWNSWNKFRNQVSDQLVRETADGMVKSGMKDAGYLYINIDDTWEGPRDANGNITTNERFPNMKALADYIHSKGLKFGIYSSPGPTTCAGYPGSFEHEAQDAKTYAQWGVDYLKYDWCSAGGVYQGLALPAVYAKMGQALLDSGRPIVYSLCEYGAEKVQDWGAKAGGNLWRTTGDIRDTWDSMAHIGFDQQEALTGAAQPGHFNDPDMLEIGNGGMSDTEYRTHMSLWAMLAAPLLAGNDLRSMPDNIREILTNKEVIAIDQDKLGRQGKRVTKTGDLEIWTRPLAGGALAVSLFNRGGDAAKMTVNASDIGWKRMSKVRDLWAHADGAGGGAFSADVPSHGVVLLRVEGK